MTQILFKSTVASGLILGVIGVAQAQPPVPAPPPKAGPPPVAYRAKEILGTKVSIQNNSAVGTVDDIVFTDAGEVEYLVVESGGKLVTVPWAAAVFNPSQRTATVNISPDQYRAIPTYTVTTYPQFFTPTYRSEVYRYYGLTPGQLRRLERRGAIP